ncbi:holin [Pseudomonas aeruginosa]|nr:holin [Pseudomonas aeruginosa]
MSERAGMAVEVVGVSVANKTTLAGALAGALGWLAQINWVGLIGVLVAIIGLLANIYFQESAARIEAIRGRCDVEQP